MPEGTNFSVGCCADRDRIAVGFYGAVFKMSWSKVAWASHLALCVLVGCICQGAVYLLFEMFTHLAQDMAPRTL